MSDLLNKKIMIIDDNEFSRTLVMVKLRKHGYENLILPQTSIEAWDKIANAQLSDHPFDLVITDLNMPGIDGMDLISKIKEDPLSENIEIIVVSADADQTIINITKTLGARAYLVKPFVTKEMLAVVEAVLRKEEIPKVRGMLGGES